MISFNVEADNDYQTIREDISEVMISWASQLVRDLPSLNQSDINSFWDLKSVDLDGAVIEYEYRGLPTASSRAKMLLINRKPLPTDEFTYGDLLGVDDGGNVTQSGFIDLEISRLELEFIKAIGGAHFQ